MTDACKQVFEKIKTKKDYRYVVFYIKDEKFIDVESTGKIQASSSYSLCINQFLIVKLFAISPGDRESSYESFLEKLKIVNGAEKECRYGLFDFEYTHQCQGTQEVSLRHMVFFFLWSFFSKPDWIVQGKKEKLFLMSWCPDDAKVKKKMLYSSSFDALKKALVGVAKYIQVRDRNKSYRGMRAKIWLVLFY